MRCTESWSRHTPGSGCLDPTRTTFYRNTGGERAGGCMSKFRSVGQGGVGAGVVGWAGRGGDGVGFLNGRDPAIVRFSARKFRERVELLAVELIEAKPALNRSVIGQIVAGRDMFLRDYGVDVQRSVVVC